MIEFPLGEYAITRARNMQQQGEEKMDKKEYTYDELEGHLDGAQRQELNDLQDSAYRWKIAGPVALGSVLAFFLVLRYLL
jgi:hypothetical protein